MFRWLNWKVFLGNMGGGDKGESKFGLNSRLAYTNAMCMNTCNKVA